MPRLRQVPRAEADPSVLPMYDFLFGDRIVGDPAPPAPAGFEAARFAGRRSD